MRVFISVDIEGITGISTWKEAAEDPTYEAKKRMTEEVRVACETAVLNGATEIVIKDAHGEGKNLFVEQLPECVKVISGWSNHPYSMVEGLDETFDGIIFMGYHSPALSNTSPLAHTLEPRKIRGIYLNDKPASELTLFSLVAKSIGVPIIAITGDGGIIRESKYMDSAIPTVATQEGFGGAMISVHPALTLKRIAHAVEEGMQKIKNEKVVFEMSEPFNIKVMFKRHQDAYKYSFYPQAKQLDEVTISLTSERYVDLLAFLLFI